MGPDVSVKERILLANENPLTICIAIRTKPEVNFR